MNELSRAINILETITLPGDTSGMNSSKRSLPTAYQIADDYNNPYFNAVSTQSVIVIKPSRVFGGLYV